MPRSWLVMLKRNDGSLKKWLIPGVEYGDLQDESRISYYAIKLGNTQKMMGACHTRLKACVTKGQTKGQFEYQNI